MTPNPNKALLVQIGAAAHVALLWLAYLGINRGTAHVAIILWVCLSILWLLVWPALILIKYRQIGPVVVLIVSGMAWAPLATPVATYAEWAKLGFAPSFKLPR